jgi:hypothetical protein
MTCSDFPYGEFHSLWPRADGAIRFLSYIYRACSDGHIPRLTDELLAEILEKHPVTIGRWRAHWESVGILKTKQRHGGTHYAIDHIALAIAVAEGKAKKERARTEARARKLVRRVARDTETAELLRQQCLTSFPQTQQFAELKPKISTPLQETRKKRSFVLKDSENDLNENRGSHILEPDAQNPGPEPETNPNATRQSHLEAESDETFKNASENNHQENAISAAARAWFFEAAKRLIANSGKRWNKTLQLALNALDTDRLINLISAFWEQTLKGNVQDGPKWLCKAAQKVANGNSYRPTRKFRVPGHLPEPPAIAPAPGPSSTLPSWLPVWAVRPAEILLKAIGSFDRIETVDDGIQVFWDGGAQFIADPKGRFSSRFSHLA